MINVIFCKIKRPANYDFIEDFIAKREADWYNFNNRKGDFYEKRD